MRLLERFAASKKPVAQLVAAHNWSRTKLGPPEHWPQSLQAAVGLCLESPALVGIFWGSEYNVLYNDAWKQLIGDRHPFALGRPASELFSRCWDELAAKCFQTVATGEGTVAASQLFVSHAGDHYLDHNLSPLRDDDGEVRGLLVMSAVSADSARRVKEARYSTLLSAAAAGIAESDRDGFFTYVNDRYCEMVGRSRDELVGRMSFLDITHPGDASQNSRMIDAMAETGEPFSMEKRYLRPDGSILWAHTFVSWVRSHSESHGRWVAASIDITQRKLAEEAGRESDERKTFLLRLGDRLRPLSDPLAVMDAAAHMLGEYLGVNRVSYGEISADGSVHAGRDYVNGVERLPKRLLLAEYAPEVLEHFRRDLTCVQSDIYLDEALTEQQREAWGWVAVRAHVSVPLMKNGRLVAALGVHQATPRAWTEMEVMLIEETAERTWAAVEQARAEAALRSSEARLSAIFSQAAVGISEISLHGRFMHVNDELCRLFGRSREQLLGMNVADVTHPDDVEGGLVYLAQLVKTGEPGILDVRCLRLDGSIIDVSTALSRLDDQYGRPRAMLAVTVDLSERKRAEAALRDSEERYRTLFSSIDEGFSVLDVLFDDTGKPLDYVFLEVNPAFEKHTGLSDVVGKRMRKMVPEHEEKWFETYGRVALTGEPRRFVDEARALGGRWFDVYAFRFGDSDSRRVAVIFSDITDRIKAEEELKQADRRKNEFLAMLAHELRNPLAPIRTGLEVLWLSQGQKETTERMLELMGRQMQQMVRLVDDLLDISRITQGKLHIRREICNLKGILDSAVESSRPFIGASGVRLTLDAPAEPIELYVDPARLAQVFSNLLNNAAKYTDAGGQVMFCAERREHELIVSVRDTGTGIPVEMLQHIFDAFTQVENSLHRSHGGLGVGLSLVKTLVELHGGSVSAHSEGLGRGCQFTVRLPGVITLDQDKPEALQECGEDSAHSCKILVVDDNVDAAQSLAMMLNMMGHEVRTAHNGLEGVAVAEEFRPQLLLLDLGMPELDGYEAARRIRQRPWGKSMIIAALTGWGQDEDRRRSREAGFDHHLVKPVELECLEHLLKQLPQPAQ